MRLEQRLTPQLIQSMDILQLNVADLEQRIAEELEKNVALECSENGSADTAEAADAPDAQPESAPTLTAPPDKTDADVQSFNRLDRLEREYDPDLGDNGNPLRRSAVRYDDRDPKIDAMANTAARPESLAEHLVQQWTLLELDEGIRRAGQALIFSLDDDGYLRTHLEEIAADTRPPIALQDLEAALPQVQRLDPIGVAARDYQECLLIQLQDLPGDNLIERQLIQHHLHDVVRNRYPAVAKASGFSTGEIAEAVKVISTHLHLHPAFLVIERQVPRIRPDIIIEYAEDGKALLVRLTRGNMPTLLIAPQYTEMLKEKKVKKDVRAFIRKQVDNAGALIDAVGYRRSSLLDVARCVAQRQRAFFYEGPSGLQILRMSDLALELECDPSTISRTVADKYIQSPRGIYPLRYFFTGGTESATGQATSWDSVKDRVRELIENEDATAPYDDAAVAAKLKDEGIDLSRRTVAKYRQQLDIPSARQRRKY